MDASNNLKSKYKKMNTIASKHMPMATEKRNLRRLSTLASHTGRNNSIDYVFSRQSRRGSNMPRIDFRISEDLTSALTKQLRSPTIEFSRSINNNYTWRKSFRDRSSVISQTPVDKVRVVGLNVLTMDMAKLTLSRLMIITRNERTI